MINITYIEDDGTEHEVQVDIGISLMEAAKEHDIPGIEGDCGGACACASCHVYVDDNWLNVVPEMQDNEKGMVEFAYNPDPQTSRLSCQLKATEEMDGMKLRMPERQV